MARFPVALFDTAIIPCAGPKSSRQSGSLAMRASADDRPVSIPPQDNALVALTSETDVMGVKEVTQGRRPPGVGFGCSPSLDIVECEDCNTRPGAVRVKSVAGGGGNGRVVVRVEFGFCAGRADFAAFDDCPISYAKIRAPACAA